jgi:hypothetical protein
MCSFGVPGLLVVHHFCHARPERLDARRARGGVRRVVQTGDHGIQARQSARAPAADNATRHAHRAAA